MKRHFEWSHFKFYMNWVLRRNEKSPDIKADCIQSALMSGDFSFRRMG